MAIRDLLWACPQCGREGGLQPARDRAEVCTACRTTFRRGRGASIVAVTPDGTSLELSPAEWVGRLPDLESIERFRADRPEHAALHEERARARFVDGERIIRKGRTFMNRVETFGPYIDGRLRLDAMRITFRPDRGEARGWTLDSITAVQPSSSTLQIKARGEGVVSFTFPDGSARFWEEIVCLALRRRFRQTGKGEISEFQPRIVAR